MRPRSYRSVVFLFFFHTTCALEVTKVSLLPFSPSACSKLPKCLYFLVPVPPAPSKLPKCHHFSLFPPDLRPRSHESVATFVFPGCLASSKLLKCNCLQFFHRLAPTKLPRSYQSVATFVLPARLAPSKLPWADMGQVPNLFGASSAPFRIKSAKMRLKGF